MDKKGIGDFAIILMVLLVIVIAGAYFYFAFVKDKGAAETTTTTTTIGITNTTYLPLNKTCTQDINCSNYIRGLGIQADVSCRNHVCFQKVVG